MRNIYSKKLKAQTLNESYDIDKEIWGLEDNLISNQNFLRIPFFNACKDEGII